MWTEKTNEAPSNRMKIIPTKDGKFAEFAWDRLVVAPFMWSLN